MITRTQQEQRKLRGGLEIATVGKSVSVTPEEALVAGKALLSSSEIQAAAECFGRAKELSRKRRSAGMRSEASLGLARCLLKSGDLEGAKAECKHILQAAGDSERRAVAEAHMLVAQAELAGGRPAAARAAGEAALEALSDGGDERLVAECERALGIAAAEEGDLDRAEDFFQSYLVAQRRFGDKHAEARGLNNLAVVAKRRGQFSEALRHHRRVLGVMRDLEDAEKVGIALRNVGITLTRIGRLADARSNLEESLEICEEHGFERDAVAARISLARVTLLEGEVGQAEKLAGAALAVSREKGYRRAEALALECLGEVAATRGSTGRAGSLYNDALVVAKTLSAHNDVAPGIQLKRAELAAQEGKLKEAGRACKAARELASFVADRSVAACVARMEGLLAAKAGEPSRAIDLLAHAEEELIWMGARFELGKLYVERAELFAGGLLDRPGRASSTEAATLDVMRARAIFCETGGAPWIERCLGVERMVGISGAVEAPSAASCAKHVRARSSTEERLDLARDFPGTVTGNPAMLNLLERVKMVAPSTAPVLIAGESGVGKELIAAAMHRLSGRKGRFVALNTGALPRELYESELFGHARGAFSGADRERKGLVEVADGGTLFLDEIGDMPAELQVRLLRVLQDGEFRRVGESRARYTSARIVSATHRDLKSLVEKGSFRNDLFYRLCTVILDVPPLRDRLEDVPALLEHFATLYARLEGKQIRGVAPDALELLTRYEWRENNVRELENEIRRGVALCSNREAITPELLSPHLLAGGANGGDCTAALPQKILALERQLICEALMRFAGNKTRAAEFLGISRSGLGVKMGKLGIDATGLGGVVPQAA